MVTNLFKSLLDFEPFVSLSGLFSGSLGARTGEGVFLKKRKEKTNTQTIQYNTIQYSLFKEGDVITQ